MANPFSIGLPNQALKGLQSQFQQSVLQTIPFEYDVAATVGAGSTDVIATTTVASNHKITIDSFFVTASATTDVFTFYRNGTAVLTYLPAVAGQSVQVFPQDGGKELDEGETWKVEVTSAAGGDVQVSLSGRDELKRQMLYSPLIA